MLKNLRPSTEAERLALQEIQSRCQVVVLRCPYETISDPRVSSLLGRIARFKIESYRREYPYGILPFDAVDVVGSHFLLCDRSGSGLAPLMGFKTITAERCRTFHLPHPALGLLGSRAQHPEHFAEVERIIEMAQSAGKTLGYFGSWTIRDDVRRDRVTLQLCQELSAALLVNACDLLGFDQALTVAVSRFNVEPFHRFMGFEPLGPADAPLARFASDAMMGDECSFSFMSDRARLSDNVRQLTGRYSDFWTSRLEIA